MSKNKSATQMYNMRKALTDRARAKGKRQSAKTQKAKSKRQKRKNAKGKRQKMRMSAKYKKLDRTNET
ncbi:MAG: hypothetical protein ACE3JK_08665 [Sporolactobacillus sp.]